MTFDPRMKFQFRSTTAFFFLLTFSSIAWGGELAGLWQEYDDDTGNLVALIRIEKLPDSTYDGKIEKILSVHGENPESVCGRCTGSLHDHPLVGLRILSGMKRAGKLSFEGGEILDPDDGKTYRCRIRLSDDGNTIEVTGYLNLNWIGQSEIWRRAE